MSIEIIDHRTIRKDISLGGTSRPFELESTDGHGFRAKVVDDYGDTTAVEALYGEKSLLKVTYSSGLEIFYDYGGNLQRLVMPLVAFYRSLSSEGFDQLNPDTVAAVRILFEYGADIIVEIDLTDGLVLGDMSGWLQMIPDAGRMEKIDGGTGGREIRAGETTRPYVIEVNDEEGVPVGEVYLTVGLEGGALLVGVGDDRLTMAVKYRRLVDPEGLEWARNPIGALNLLVSLQAGSD